MKVPCPYSPFGLKVPGSKQSYRLVVGTLAIIGGYTVGERGAHTGLGADVKIYVLSIEQAVRFSTGERDDVAV